MVLLSNVFCSTSWIVFLVLIGDDCSGMDTVIATSNSIMAVFSISSHHRSGGNYLLSVIEMVL